MSIAAKMAISSHIRDTRGPFVLTNPCGRHINY
jgi:hypothetical protein